MHIRARTSTFPSVFYPHSLSCLLATSRSPVDCGLAQPSVRTASAGVAIAFSVNFIVSFFFCSLQSILQIRGWSAVPHGRTRAMFANTFGRTHCITAVRSYRITLSVNRRGRLVAPRAAPRTRRSRCRSRCRPFHAPCSAC